MMRQVVVVLLQPGDEVETLQVRVASATRMAEAIDVLAPPDSLRGTGFWTDSEAAQMWWESNRLDDCEVAMAMRDRPGLEDELRDLDTWWAVWCPTSDRAAAYADAPRVAAIPAADCQAFAVDMLTALAKAGWRIPQSQAWGPFLRRHEGRPPAAPGAVAEVAVTALGPADPALPRSTAQAAADAVEVPAEDGDVRQSAPRQLPPLPRLEWEPSTPGTGHPDTAAHAPTLVSWDIIPAGAVPPTEAADPVQPADRGTAGVSTLAARNGRGPVREWFARVLGRGDGAAEVNVTEIAQILTSCHDTIVLVCSRKGGVGKTTESLGLGFLAAQAVGALGGATVVIDANVTNADVSVKLRLPDRAPTVREVVNALMTNQPVPAPVAAHRSALRVYGEHRETERYTAPEIAALATHLRAFYPLAVIDLPNALPGLADKAEAVVEAWLPHADVVVVPIDTSLASFEGAADMLAAITEVKDRREGASSRPGVVVGFLTPRDVAVRRVAPDLDKTLNRLEAEGARIIDIPSSPRMAMIEWSDSPVPLTDADPAVTRAYWRLLAAVAAVRASVQP